MASRTVEIFKELSYLFAELAEETEREEWIREEEREEDCEECEDEYDYEV